MKTYIHFVKPNKKAPLFSWLIRLFEGTNYSHCAIEIAGQRASMVFESISPASRVVGKSVWLKRYRIVESYEFTLGDGFRGDAFEWCLANTDRPYSMRQIFSIAIGYVASGFKRKTGFSINGDNRFICVEACARFAQNFLGFGPFETPIDALGIKEFNKAVKDKVQKK